MSALWDFLVAPPAGVGADDSSGSRQPSRGGGARGALRPLARLGALLLHDRTPSHRRSPEPEGIAMDLGAALVLDDPRPPEVPSATDPLFAAGSPPAADPPFATDALAAPDPRSTAPVSTAARSAVAILCATEDARAVGVAAAVLLARAARTPTALACLWTAPNPPRHPDARPPATRGARRLAAALAARGLDAVPCGRAATVALPADPSAALAAAGRAAAAAAAAPVVLVLGGPRDAAFDDLLAVQDRLLVVTRPGPGEAIAGLALAGLPDPAPPAGTCALAFGPAGRALAAAGLAVPAPLRAALREPRSRR